MTSHSWLNTLAVFALTALTGFAQQNLSVTGDAEIKVAPDQVILSLGVEVHSKTLADARRENDSRIRNMRDAARKSGIEEKDLQTDFIQLGMQYRNDGVTPDYYYTRKSFVVTLRDVNRMEDVLAALVDAGATHIHGVEFETTKLREYRDKARAMAVQAAKEKARDIAAAAGMKVIGNPVGISAANYGGHSWYGMGWGGSRGAFAQNVSIQGGDSSGGPGTIALGRISVTATVSMTFHIE